MSVVCPLLNTFMFRVKQYSHQNSIVQKQYRKGTIISRYVHPFLSLMITNKLKMIVWWPNVNIVFYMEVVFSFLLFCA